MPALKIHPNAPPRLVKRYRKAGSFHKLSKELYVNVSYIHDLITKGIEPSDRTEHGRAIRRQLYLPSRKPKGKPRKPRPPKPAHMVWWSRQDVETIIKQLYDLNKDSTP